jgi:hypothetical protein
MDLDLERPLSRDQGEYVETTSRFPSLTINIDNWYAANREGKLSEFVFHL